MSDDEYYAESPYDEFEEMLWDADPAPNLADDLAQHTAYSPVWQDDPAGELDQYHSDWEYYSDDYYDDDLAILQKSPVPGEPQRTLNSLSSPVKRGKKRLLREIYDAVDSAEDRSLRNTIQGTVWAQDVPSDTKDFRYGQNEKVALLINWRERFRINRIGATPEFSKKPERDESWANNLSLADMGLVQAQESKKGTEDTTASEDDPEDQGKSDDEGDDEGDCEGNGYGEDYKHVPHDDHKWCGKHTKPYQVAYDHNDLQLVQLRCESGSTVPTKRGAPAEVAKSCGESDLHDDRASKRQKTETSSLLRELPGHMREAQIDPCSKDTDGRDIGTTSLTQLGRNHVQICEALETPKLTTEAENSSDSITRVRKRKMPAPKEQYIDSISHVTAKRAKHSATCEQEGNQFSITNLGTIVQKAEPAQASRSADL